MKKNSILISIIITLGLLLTTACNQGFTDDPFGAPNTQSDGKTGSASFNIVVPDYYAMANASRAVAPQSVVIKFEYKKANGEWYFVDAKNLTDSSVIKTDMDVGVPQGLSSIPAKIYNCTFSSIPTGAYPEGWMRIRFTSSTADNATVFSEGTNGTTVNILMGETSVATFYTLPNESITTTINNGDSESHTVSDITAANTMKFIKYSFDADHVSTLTINLPNGSTTYPDVVVFDSKGKFEKYIRPTAENHAISCAGYNTAKYFGFYFASNPNTFSYQFAHQEESNTSTLFQTILADHSGWEIENLHNFNGSNPALHYSTENNPSSPLEFIYDADYPQNTSLWYSITFSQAKTISFKVCTNLDTTKDGYLDFYIDDVKQDGYTGSSNGFVSKSYSITAGIHTIRWVKNDTNAQSSSNALTGQSATVQLKDFAIVTATSSSGSGN